MTLLEVIVAMTVLAIGITGVLGAISACLRNTDTSTSYSRGALLAQQVAAEFDRRDTLEAENLDGTFDDVTTTYTWEAEVSSANEQGLYPVHITVFWDDKRHHYDLYTLLHPHTIPTATPASTNSASGNTGGAANGSDSTTAGESSRSIPTTRGTR